ncbi:MAG: AAA family ATPase, partial [Leptospiraceae bacterium]|nr:AAA family ATPase [Leptospiraceae bacterium]
MKVRSIIIKNYKILENLELHFTDLNGRTLDTIVLAGDNGCGKTTVLNLINRALSPIPFPVPFCKELRMVISFTEDQKELIISSLTGLEGTELLEKSGIRVSEFISRFENRKNVELVYSEIQKEGKTEVEKNDFNLFIKKKKASAYSHMNGLKLLYTNKEVDHKFNSLSTEPDLKHNIYSFYSSILTESESKESRILK